MVYSIEPNFGYIDHLMPVTINGTFPTDTVVFFGSNPGGDAVNNGSSITVTPPVGTEGQVTVTFSSNIDKTVSGDTLIFSYRPVPTIIEFGTDFIYAQNALPVTIRGSDLTEDLIVLFGAEMIDKENYSTSEIIVTSPSLETGSVTVTVRSSAYPAVSNTLQLNVISVPVITGFGTDFIYAQNTLPVTIRGSDLTEDLIVLFGADTVVRENDSTSEIIVASPSLETGSVTVTVRSSAYPAVSNTLELTVIPVPTIEGVSPSPSDFFTPVTIYGTGFDLDTTIFFGNSEATIDNSVIFNSRMILIPMPPRLSGEVIVSVSSIRYPDMKVDNGITFTYIPQLAITSFYPTFIYTNDDSNTITINGAYLDTVESVLFGETTATIISQLPTELVVQIVGQSAGESFVVLNNGTESVYENGFSFREFPTVTGFDPQFIFTIDNSTSVTLTGINFTDDIAVYFGETSANVTYIDSNIIVKPPPSSSSSNVVLRLQSVTYPNIFSSPGSFSYLQFPCFATGSRILTNHGYVPVESLRRGDKIKTLKHGYVPIALIGFSSIHNSGDERIKDRLYLCSNENYPDLVNDLVITGCHSILVESFQKGEEEKVMDVLGNIYITDGHYRLPACVDSRAKPYTVEGEFTIWHLALENDDYYMNYGIYAEGLLVESCSQRTMKELTKMTML